MKIPSSILFAKTAIASVLLFALFTLIVGNQGVVEAIPKGFMTFFDAAACPPQWTEYESSQGRLIVSITNSANAGITVGVPLQDQEDRTHTHRTVLTGHLAHRDVSGASGGNNEGALHGQVSTTFVSEPAPTGLPYTQLILCRIQSEFADSNPVAMGTFGFFDPSVNSCPNINVTKSSKKHLGGTGTTWIPAQAVAGRILIGGYNEGGGLPNNQPSYSSGEDRQHNHVGNVVEVPGTPVDYIGVGGCCNAGPSQFVADLAISGNTDNSSSNLPYVQLLTCQSTDFTFNLTLPSGALVFSSEKCPPGWEIDLELAGRFLVSLPENGQPGAYFGGRSISPNLAVDPVHTHAFNATIQFPPVGIELAEGCCSGNYFGSGEGLVLGRSTNADVDVPFTMFPLCRQTSDRKNKEALARSVVRPNALKHKIKMNNNKKH